VSISFSSLAALVGAASPLRVSTSLGEVALDVVEARPAPEPRTGGSVLLRGPREPHLAQGTYPVRAPGAAQGDGPDDVEEPLFLVPVAEDSDAVTYEAVFG
jgi:hypothetical protein